MKKMLGGWENRSPRAQSDHVPGADKIVPLPLADPDLFDFWGSTAGMRTFSENPMQLRDED